MKTIFSLLFLLPLFSMSQNLNARLEKAVELLQQDEQLKNGSIGIYIADTKTGKVVYQKNAETGLVPASCQKVLTSVTAFELLGNNYTFKTNVEISGKVEHGILEGDLIITGFGDPAFGSKRWQSTNTEAITGKIVSALKSLNIRAISGNIIINDMNFGYQPLPDGWIWQDIGNYYGAGASGFNWNENQFDLYLRSGDNPGAPVEIIGTAPIDLKANITTFITAGKKGSGDNGYIYASPYSTHIFATGTIPAGEKKFTISGSMPEPAKYFGQYLKNILLKNNIEAGSVLTATAMFRNGNPYKAGEAKRLLTLQSPSLDSMNFWFLRKSVNLYGEAMVKAMAYEKNKEDATTPAGIDIIRAFWQKAGIDKSALMIMDGSGLSPANRVTAKALVSMLQFAKNRQWYTSFYEALPIMNGIKMKDGYINGVRSYTGYIRSASGSEYTFAFIVNNFYGSAAGVREKMWKILDMLK